MIFGIKINWSLLEKIEKFLIIILIVIGLSFNIPFVYTFIKCDIFNDASDSAIMITYFSAITAALVSVVFKIGERTDLLKEALDEHKINTHTELFFKGTIGIYKDVEDEIALLNHAKKPIEIDILGFTLFSVKDKFRSWKENGISNLTVNLFHLDPNFIIASPHIDSSWVAHVNLYVDEIKKFSTTEAVYLRKKKIKINFFPLTYIPHVHGFRLRNSSIYVSFSMWDHNNLLYNPADRSIYTKIQNGDTSKNATYLRNLFDNWVKKGKGMIQT